jgi:hypothetical protein
VNDFGQMSEGHVGEIWTDVLGWSEGEIIIGDEVSLGFNFLSFLLFSHCHTHHSDISDCSRDGLISNVLYVLTTD